jgi:hypothetical protein
MVSKQPSRMTAKSSGWSALSASRMAHARITAGLARDKRNLIGTLGPPKRRKSPIGGGSGTRGDGINLALLQDFEGSANTFANVMYMPCTCGDRSAYMVPDAPGTTAVYDPLERQGQTWDWRYDMRWDALPPQGVPVSELRLPFARSIRSAQGSRARSSTVGALHGRGPRP